MIYRSALLIKLLLSAVLFLSGVFGQDWANLKRYSTLNQEFTAQKSVPGRVVLYGNSITEGWPKFDPDWFAGNAYIPRGISGQTTSQMLVRFRQDVIGLKPALVVILAGTNDIAGNTGPMTLDEILGNIISMSELARANGIKVVIASILPAEKYPWKPELTPAAEIVQLNSMLKKYAWVEGHTYLDYFTKMANRKNGLKAAFTYDGVHPNLEGYQVMEPLLEKAVKKALKQ